MNSKISRWNRYGALIGAALFCVAATSGCTTPRQYQINESILIGERRQLEDEIYRLQFELRDALAENERLSAKLDEASTDGSNGSSTRKSGVSRVRNAAKAPANGKPRTSIDENLYPGGDLLRTQPSTNDYGNRYPEYPTLDMNEVSQLPDFVAVPKRARDTRQPSAGSDARQAGYQASRRPSGVSQVAYQEAPKEEEEYPDVEEEYDEYEEEEYEPAEYDETVDDEDEEDAPTYDYDYEDELPEETSDEWSPVPERR